MKQELSHAIQLLKSGQAEQAQITLAKLCKQYPHSSDAFNALGFSHLAMAEQQKALVAFEKVIELSPNKAIAWENLAGAYFEMGKLELAEVNFKKALTIDVNHYQAWHFLSLIQYKNKEYEQAFQSQIKTEKNDPFISLVAQAESAIESNDTNKTITLCQQIIQRHQRHPKARFLLAMLAAQKGHLEQAVDEIQQGLNYAPYDHKLRNFLSQVYAQLRDYQNALMASNIIVKQVPNEHVYWLLHADNLLNAGQYQQALIAYQTADNCQQSTEQTHLQQGHIYKAIGNQELCIQAYKKCLENNDTVGSAYWGLANVSNNALDEIDIDKLKSLQLNPELSVEQACQATFALAKCYEQRGQYQLAFTTYQTANLNRSGNSFLPEQHQKKCDAIINTFTKTSMQVHAPIRANDITPIFIVGLPRSGSTLIEQILASHSLVEGTMELKTIPAIARQVFLKSIEKNNNKSGCLNSFTSSELAEYGEKYIQESQIYRTNKPYFIDKLPPNFQHIGLIKKILPHAIIIDARRQPMACGFGIYKQYFGHGHDFSYNLEHIAFYYQQYLRVMEHWNTVLPSAIFCCQYETMISDTEKQIRALLKFCGLAFEDNCLTFHNNKRPVRTASSDQVRRPINNEGIEMWKNYQQQLQPLKDALGNNVIKSFQHLIN